MILKEPRNHMERLTKAMKTQIRIADRAAEIALNDSGTCKAFDFLPDYV